MRVPCNAVNVHGSQKWIQKLINDYPAKLNHVLCESLNLGKSEKITWLSPLRNDDYSEYRDQDFISRLGIKLPNLKLEEFWPQLGPQWDALGRISTGTGSDKIFLIEAKANIPEIISTACLAPANSSKALILKRLREVQDFLGIKQDVDWSGKFYQYTNRIVHLYFLREINKISAYLVFIYFIGDKDVNGPNCESEWQAALTVAKGYLGIGERNRLSKFIIDVYLDIAELSASAS